MTERLKIGFDAKRIVRNGTGLGSYGRTLANDMATVDSLDLRLYAPDSGRDDLRLQVPERDNLHFFFPPSSPPSSFLCPQSLQVLLALAWHRQSVAA
jgi:hypothetical protein